MTFRGCGVGRDCICARTDGGGADGVAAAHRGAGDLSGHRYATAGTGGGRGRAAEIDAPNQGGFAGIHFQKTDSALRGNIAAELGVLLEITARVRAVFVPANPSRGRTIRGGEYWIGDTPLHETDFARDPQHPSTTANVAARLGNDPAITIPDATTEADVLTAASV